MSKGWLVVVKLDNIYEAASLPDYHAICGYIQHGCDIRLLASDLCNFLEDGHVEHENLPIVAANR